MNDSIVRITETSAKTTYYISVLVNDEYEYNQLSHKALLKYLRVNHVVMNHLNTYGCDSYYSLEPKLV